MLKMTFAPKMRSGALGRPLPRFALEENSRSRLSCFHKFHTNHKLMPNMFSIFPEKFKNIVIFDVSRNQKGSRFDIPNLTFRELKISENKT